MLLPELRWLCLPFAELHRDLLYDLLQLRSAVFVVEQDCVYQDLDGHDRQSLHLCGMAEGKIACYARLNPPELKFPAAAISRVIVSRKQRGGGLGSILLREAIARCEQHWPGAKIQLSAQQHLVDFYAAQRFRQVSAPYDDTGIPHVDMVR